MRIGELSTTSGCPVETIRYFEKIGLLPHGNRTYADERLSVLLRLQRLRGRTQAQIR